jgi:hypothetical protein
MVATYEDANLVVQLMRWGTEMGLEDSIAAIFSDAFDADDGSIDSPDVRKVLYFGETLGTLVKHDVLDRELLRDLLWIDGIWSKVGAYARYAREKAGEPALYENFEGLATKRDI